MEGSLQGLPRTYLMNHAMNVNGQTDAEATDRKTETGQKKAAVRIFGIRHHGPGSARSLAAELETFQPDCLLVEGPPEGEACLELALDPGMTPPVALLSYVPDRPRQAIYNPFAEFSPEWQAIRFGLTARIPVRFIDIPLAHEFGLAIELEEKAGGNQENVQPAQEQNGVQSNSPHRDPLRWLAEAAGFSDGERWWEFMIEQRGSHLGVFDAILSAMTALRAEMPPLPDPEDQLREDRREAFMRLRIREAMKEGFLRIAVVCGAWHAPVLVPESMPKIKDDQALTKGLPKTKVQTTWIPWTNGRLSLESGYRAGVESPGWYGYLWNHRTLIAERWLTLVARLLRGQGLDASSAQVIEAVRLAEALSSMRDRPLPGLPELEESSRAIFCFGSDAPLALIRTSLMIGETLGKVPENTPLAPLMADLQREQKRLRFPPKASSEILTLDLRKENDLDRSRLLHRLILLGLDWGELHDAGKSRGTFKEVWQTAWKPEFALILIERGSWGNTVPEAAEAYIRHLADQSNSLETLTTLIGNIFLADLPAASTHAVLRLQSEAAVASDVTHLMRALPALARVTRYGNVRQTDVSLMREVVGGMAARVCVGLPLACGSLNDEAATEMLGLIDSVNEGLRLLQDESILAPWREALTRTINLPGINGLIGGRGTRLLLDDGAITLDEGARRFSMGLSDPDHAVAAGWLEGFLGRSGLILIHDERLWGLVAGWINNLPAKSFDEVLPLIRRTFSQFPAAERRQLGGKIRHGGGNHAATRLDRTEIRQDRAEAALRTVAGILGLRSGNDGGQPPGGQS